MNPKLTAAKHHQNTSAASGGIIVKPNLTIPRFQ
jgi:hypothetical protein